MTVRFHPPEDQRLYADHALAILLQAALPRAGALLDRLREEAGWESGGSDAGQTGEEGRGSRRT